MVEEVQPPNQLKKIKFSVLKIDDQSGLNTQREARTGNLELTTQKVRTSYEETSPPKSQVKAKNSYESFGTK